MDKAIRKVTDPEEQQMETYRYWQSQPIGARLEAVWEVSEAAYAFSAAFRGSPVHVAEESERSFTRIQRSRC